MNDEQTLNQQVQQESKGVSIVDILLGLRAHLVLILIVTLLFAVGGFAYAKVRKPVYTASVPVQFDVDINSVDTSGNDTSNQNSYTYLFAYVDTADGICKSGNVIDRANVYYYYYLQSGKNIDVFIRELTDAYKTVKTTHGEIPDYGVTEELLNEYRNKWFNSSKVGTKYSASSNSSEARVDFSLWVKNLDSGKAKEMARIYVLAADVSLNKILVLDNGTAGLLDLAGSVSGVSASPDMTTTKVVIVAVILGLALAFLTVYIIYLLDNTVKSKEQLEEMSGASVIAYIDDVAEVQ